VFVRGSDFSVFLGNSANRCADEELLEPGFVVAVLGGRKDLVEGGAVEVFSMEPQTAWICVVLWMSARATSAKLR
jgi:hypothetical protein